MSILKMVFYKEGFSINVEVCVMMHLCAPEGMLFSFRLSLPCLLRLFSVSFQSLFRLCALLLCAA